MKAAKVTYQNGDIVVTSMSPLVSDESILNYFAPGNAFNGTTVKSCEIVQREFMGTCDRFRRESERHNERWYQMKKNRKPISEKLFLETCNVLAVLDDGETWEEYKSGSPDLKFFRSRDDNYKTMYFFQTAGFEFIFE